MAGAGLVFAAGPATAGNAESVHLGGVDTTATVGYGDDITVDLRDAGAQIDAGYTGTVTFSAVGSAPDCVDCFTVTPNSGSGANAFKYTFTPADGGVRHFSVSWLTPGAGKVLTVTAVLADGPDPGTDPDSDTDTATVAVLAQTATTGGFDSSGAGAVDLTPTIGVDDLVTVSFRNANGDIDTG